VGLSIPIKSYRDRALTVRFEKPEQFTGITLDQIYLIVYVLRKVADATLWILMVFQQGTLLAGFRPFPKASGIAQQSLPERTIEVLTVFGEQGSHSLMVVNGQPTTCQAETNPKAEAVVKGIMLAVGSFWPLACRFILRGQLAPSGVKCYSSFLHPLC